MHGMSRLFDALIDEVVYETRQQRRYADETLREPAGRGPDIEQEVKMVYARGEVPANTYHRLLEMARSGDLEWADLARAREEADTGGTARRPRDRSAEIVRELNKLYDHRQRLEAAETETQEVLARLQGEAERRREQVEKTEAQAQAALPDEETARSYLEAGHDARERLKVLQERIAGLKQNLRRIRRLREELETREAELKALESGEQLAELEADIREDLLDR